MGGKLCCLRVELQRAWANAMARAALNQYAPAGAPPAGRDEAGWAEFEASLVDVSRILESFRVNPGRWGGRHGDPSNRSVLTALAFLVFRTGKRTVAAADRDLAELAGLSHSTTAAALLRLVSSPGNESACAISMPDTDRAVPVRFPIPMAGFKSGCGAQRGGAALLEVPLHGVVMGCGGDAAGRRLGMLESRRMRRVFLGRTPVEPVDLKRLLSVLRLEAPELKRAVHLDAAVRQLGAETEAQKIDARIRKHL